MGIRKCFVFYIFSAIYLKANGDDSSVVKFHKTRTNITAIEGGMVVLRCQFTNGVGLRRSWTNGTSVTFADSQKYTHDKRISLDLNTGREYSIQIRSVTAYDEGKYTCTIYSAYAKTMSVYLKVNVPARFTSDISADTTLNEGQKTVLTCVATGRPKPEVTWRHLVPSADGIMGTGFHLPLSRITREGQGIYECTANNKIAAPATRRIRVRVKYLPEMTPRKERNEVSAALGQETVLSCSASGFPIPEFVWKHYGYVYQDRKDTSRVQVLDIKYGNTVTSKLSIKAVALGDFGEYACIARNIMGSTNGTVYLKRMIREPTRPPPIVVFGGGIQGRNQPEGNGGSENSAKSTQTLSKLLAFISPLLGAKIISMFDV